MRLFVTPLAWLPLLAAGVLAWPQSAQAQAFSADYGLAPSRGVAGLQLGSIRISPVLQADARFSGVGLSLGSGRNWFAQVGLGQSLQQIPGLPARSASSDVLSIAGGYRFSEGRSLSLQLNRAKAGDRLGLAVSYDWPRYFVRLSYDTTLSPLPQDSLRFSAGVRF